VEDVAGKHTSTRRVLDAAPRSRSIVTGSAGNHSMSKVPISIMVIVSWVVRTSPFDHPIHDDVEHTAGGFGPAQDDVRQGDVQLHEGGVGEQFQADA